MVSNLNTFNVPFSAFSFFPDCTWEHTCGKTQVASVFCHGVSEVDGTFLFI